MDLGCCAVAVIYWNRSINGTSIMDTFPRPPFRELRFEIYFMILYILLYTKQKFLYIIPLSSISNWNLGVWGPVGVYSSALRGDLSVGILLTSHRLFFRYFSIRSRIGSVSSSLGPYRCNRLMFAWISFLLPLFGFWCHSGGPTPRYHTWVTGRANT